VVDHEGDRELDERMPPCGWRSSPPSLALDLLAGWAATPDPVPWQAE